MTVAVDGVGSVRSFQSVTPSRAATSAPIESIRAAAATHRRQPEEAPVDPALFEGSETVQAGGRTYALEAPKGTYVNLLV